MGHTRLSRLIGLIDSLQLILKGKPINSKKALKLQVVDACYQVGYKESFQNEFVTKIIEKKYFIRKN